MVIDVLRVVLRGAEPGERRCDVCLRDGLELRECRVRRNKEEGSTRDGYWRDACGECVAAITAAPALPPEKTQADRKWDQFLESHRAKFKSC